MTRTAREDGRGSPRHGGPTGGLPIRVTLPLPPRALSPNARSHWRARATATKQYRRTAMILAMAALDGRDAPKWSAAALRARFVHKRPNRRDGDNALASLKAAIDGLRDAGVVLDDSGLAFEPVVFEVGVRPDWPAGCVEIEVCGPGNGS